MTGHSRHSGRPGIPSLNCDMYRTYFICRLVVQFNYLLFHCCPSHDFPVLRLPELKIVQNMKFATEGFPLESKGSVPSNPLGFSKFQNARIVWRMRTNNCPMFFNRVISQIHIAKQFQTYRIQVCDQ